MSLLGRNFIRIVTLVLNTLSQVAWGDSGPRFMYTRQLTRLADGDGLANPNGSVSETFSRTHKEISLIKVIILFQQ